MKSNRLILFTLLFLLTPLLLTAEINAVLDTIYTSETAPLKESVWLVLAGAEEISSDSDLSAVNPYLKEKGWSGGTTLSAGQLATLLMDSFDLPAGLMYRITKSPRYALKDLNYYGLLTGGSYTGRGVTAFELVSCLNAVLEEGRS